MIERIMFSDHGVPAEVVKQALVFGCKEVWVSDHSFFLVRDGEIIIALRKIWLQ